MARKVPDDVQKVFDKYTVNFVRRLNKEKACEMFQKEFELCPERAEFMFEMFDKDRNSFLSAWEFYLFYQAFGYDANKFLDMYDKLSDKGKTTCDISGLWDFTKELKTLSGRCCEDEELANMIQSFAGEQERSIDKNKFVELVSRIRLTRN